MNSDLGVREYTSASRVEGPLVIIEGAGDTAYAELAEVIASDGSVRLGQVLEVSRDKAIVEIFGESAGLSPEALRVRFSGRPMQAPVAREMLGRTFNGLGEPIDGLSDPLPEDRVDVHAAPLNPAARAYPRTPIETGVSAIDALNTLVRGQKLPIFSGSGLPHNELAAQIAAQATLSNDENDAVIFAALGVSHDTAEFFHRRLKKSGALDRAALFLNLADDPPIERTVTPRLALSLAEFLAFEHDMHLLVIFTDITNYGEALREISSRREEVPTRKGYPGYLYSDLASLYERCGRAKGSDGSITLMPILTMPNDDITHPIPDMTGYITEGQVVLSRELNRREIYPPVNVLTSLSRLMKDGIGQDKTREDHSDVARQLYTAYTRAEEARDLAEIIGEEDLPRRDRNFLKFGDAFETRFLAQPQDESRSMEETLSLGWEVLSLLPRDQLTRISREHLEKYYSSDSQESDEEH